MKLSTAASSFGSSDSIQTSRKSLSDEDYSDWVACRLRSMESSYSNHTVVSRVMLDTELFFRIYPFSGNRPRRTSSSLSATSVARRTDWSTVSSSLMTAKTHASQNALSFKRLISTSSIGNSFSGSGSSTVFFLKIILHHPTCSWSSPGSGQDRYSLTAPSTLQSSWHCR
jgi:hypothetical protein